MFQTEVIVFQVIHYDMDSQRGVSCRVVGSQETTNNKFGLSVSEAKIMEYGELEYLQRFKDKLPARFTATGHFVTTKSNNGKETTGLGLTDLKFKNEVEIVDKVTVKA